MESVVYVRHFEDNGDLTCLNRDSPLKEISVEAVKHVSQELRTLAEVRGKQNICLITSPKVRAIRTASLIADQVSKHSVLPVDIETEPGIRELDQGQFILPTDYVPGDFFPPLSVAWDAYYKEVLQEKNIYYRYGDPISDEDGSRYPELVGHFTKFGENQVEFSYRFYSFLQTFAERLGRESETLFAIVTHRAIIVRTVEILQALSKPDSKELEMIPEGGLIYEEIAQLRNAREATAAYQLWGGYGIIELASLLRYNDLIAREVAYLSGIVNEE